MSTRIHRPTGIYVGPSLSSPAVASGFTPVGAPLLYLDSDSLSALSDGDPIETWVNEGSGANATSSGVNRPLFESDGASLLNGHPVVSFDSIVKQMVTGITVANEDLTFFAVVNFVGRRFIFGDDIGSPFTTLIWGGEDGEFPPGLWKGSTQVTGTGLPGMAVGTWFIIAGTIAGDGTSTFYENGSGPVAGSATAAFETNITLTVSPNGYRPFHGFTPNLIVYDSVLSEANIVANIAGLNTKYNIY